MSKRIGVVTGGGDCPGLNAVIRAVAKTSANRGWECIGILGGYEGLLEPYRTKSLDYHTHSGLLTRGGTILGTANRGKFSAKVGHGESRALPKELLEGVKTGMKALDLFALVSIGGDGSLSIAQQLFEYGIRAVVSAEIEKYMGKESRVCVLGHLQRCGSPTTFDRALCSIFGATAVELVAAGDFGKMVAFTGPQVGAIKISEAIGKLKAV